MRWCYSSPIYTVPSVKWHLLLCVGLKVNVLAQQFENLSEVAETVIFFLFLGRLEGVSHGRPDEILLVPFSIETSLAHAIKAALCLK